MSSSLNLPQRRDIAFKGKVDMTLTCLAEEEFLSDGLSSSICDQKIAYQGPSGLTLCRLLGLPDSSGVSALLRSSSSRSRS